jgi:uncharacterized protein (TIGR02246 family)
MDDEAIRQVAGAFLAAWNSHDMRAFGSLYADDADFVNVFGAYWKGAPKIENEHRALHETVFKSSRLSASQVQVKHLGPDVATMHMFWDLNGLVGPDGRALPDRRGVLVHVLVRDGAVWRIATTQNTDIVSSPYE